MTWQEKEYNKNVYNSVDIGDSIVKNKGILLLEIHKQDTIVYIDMELDCNTTK